MFITQEQLNHVLDNYFTMTDAHIFNQEYFDNSMQLILDNHHDLYDRIRGELDKPGVVAIEALRRFAQEACDNEYGAVEGITTFMLIRWIWTKDEATNYSLHLIDNTIDYITSKRAEAQNEKEDTTMKNIGIEIINDIIDLSNIGTDIVCEHCNCIVATPEAGEVESFRVINGKVYCESCADELFVECAECGELISVDDAVEIDGEYYCEECVDRYFVTCQYCGEYVREDDASLVDGEWTCEDCLDEHCRWCEDCEEYHDEDNGEWVDSVDRWVCNDCLEHNYYTCGHCGEYVHCDDSVTVNINTRGRTEEWCESCYEDYTWRCVVCSNIFSDDVDYVESDDSWERYCPNCSSRCNDTGDINTWKSPRKRMNYGFKPIPCMCATKEERQSAGSDWERSIVFFGYELEIDRMQKSYKEDKWSEKIVEKLPSTYCKQDCSLDKGGSYSGIEIVSHPATLAWYEEHIDDFDRCFTMLKEGDWLSHDAGTCGLHVHISLHALEDANPYAVNNMLFLFDRFWDKLVKFSRRTASQLNHWAKRYSTAHGNYEQIKNMAKRDADRYMAVNLQNSHTVELRMFRGTLNLETFFATLQLVDTIVKRCIEIGNDVRKLQTISWEEFVASDHKELNAYLARRGLKEGCEEQPEPKEATELCIDDLVGHLIRTNISVWEPDILANREARIVYIDSDDDIAVEFINPTPAMMNRLHDCNGRTEYDHGYWIREGMFEVID